MIDIGRGVKLIRRSEWGARAPRSVTAVNASFGTTAHWEGPHMGFPWAHAACFSLVRGIQNFHMDSRGWTDIAYTGVVCPHGYVFEGRWAGRRTAANGTNDGNNRALALCYLGGEGDEFTVDGQRAMRAGMDWLDTHGGAGPGRNGHRDWKPTECPGGEIYEWVHSGQQAGGAPSVTEEDDVTIDDLKAVLDGYAHRIAGVPDFRSWMTAVYENSRTAASEGAVDVDVDGSVDNVFKLYAAKGEQGEDTPLHRIIRQVLAES